MRILIKTMINIPEIPTEMEIESGKLRDAVDRLFKTTHFFKELVDQKTGELDIDQHIKIFLNDIIYHNLPDGLETELHDGDTLTLNLILLGGG